MHYIIWSPDFTLAMDCTRTFSLISTKTTTTKRRIENEVKRQMNQNAISCCRFVHKIVLRSNIENEGGLVWELEGKPWLHFGKKDFSLNMGIMGLEKTLTWSLLNRYTANIVNTTFVWCSHTGRFDECEYLLVIAYNSVNKNLRFTWVYILLRFTQPL